ncbi:hypothetical protein VMUT_1990 [Vulcanisaeta moutnovskia 768-28]|uniref:Uncharacterized protein n=1 Tax=Vulcanisaeta moutnovskia (strain 768-28) TaxID=985053 RepID=F0QW95_VULM7|nr:hypothetical protein [Vulcanisaeta moutnovskia]ADY02190.1 hypothetical protein VMUT_1990 [Vulcanisaeta moutnovskia 768-28]
MDIGELISILLSKGVDYVLAQLPNWISRREVSREDAELLLMYAMINRIDELSKKIDGLGSKIDILSDKIDELGKRIDARFDELGKKIDDMRKEVVDRLDLISNQLRVLNSNIAATYELTSKVMAKLMERSLTAST